MFDTIKSFLWSDQGFYGALVLLVGVTAYTLGVQSGSVSDATANPAGQSAIVFTAAPYTPLPPDTIPVIASRGGTKYHRLDCPGADTIKTKNKVYFESIQLARSAGYLPAGNCKGLE